MRYHHIVIPKKTTSHMIKKKNDHFTTIFDAKQLYKFDRDKHDVELSVDAVPADPIVDS